MNLTIVAWIVAGLLAVVTEPAYDVTGNGTSYSQEWKPFRDIDGHTDCYIKVGETSIIECGDGFRAES